MKRIIIVTLLLAPCGVAEAQRLDTISHLRPEHMEVVKRWLAASPRRANLRVATERDCRNREGLTEYRKQEGKNYNPYYAVGNFNRDGKEDFAVAFVNDRKRQRKFSLAIFNGPLSNNSVPAYIDENVDLSVMGFFYGGKGGDLLLGEFESDYCVILRPRGKTYKGQPCLED